MSVLEAAAQKAIETAACEGDRAWYEAWRQRSIAFVAGRDETGREVAIEVHRHSTCVCAGCSPRQSDRFARVIGRVVTIHVTREQRR